MSYQEAKSLINLISTWVLTGLYAAYMLPNQPTGDPYAPELFHFWGHFFLIFVPVMIVAKLIIHIGIAVANGIATRGGGPPITDERDKLFELRATRGRFLIFTFGFLFAMISLVWDMPPSTMFLILIGSGVAAETVSDLTQFVLYRRGF